ncbi:MAG: ribosome maturation factor RimP [Clostridia bacterium]|nr:ribosome maturation factor RimP [Clostridia bacterium]
MKKKTRVVDIVADIATPICKAQNLELVDVEFVKEGPHRYLRLTIDKEEGVSLDDCEAVSRALNEELDRLDPIEENYFLEVTSPGVERELKRDVDFKKFAGKTVQVKLYQAISGQKVIEGILVGLKDGYILVETGGKTIEIPKDKASTVKLLVTFDNN